MCKTFLNKNVSLFLECYKNVEKHTNATVCNATVTDKPNSLTNCISIYKTDQSTLRIVGIPNGIANLALYDILGKKLVTTSFEANGMNDISLPTIKTGVYLVRVQTEKGKINKKIVLE
jgi:uncharacterized membrane protein